MANQFNPNPFIPNVTFGIGTSTSLYNPYKIPNTTSPDNENDRAYGYENGELKKSQLGKSVISWITFNEGSYKSLNNGNRIDITEFSVINCLMTVRQAKNIVRTRLSGRDGTIKTYMGMDDFEITIEGYIVNDIPINGVYPINIVNELVKVCSASTALKINSPYLNTIFNINYIVIRDFDFEQVEGGYSQQKFTLSCLSDYVINSVGLPNTNNNR